MNHQISLMKVFGRGEYHDIIRRYFQSSFPKIAAIKGRDLLDILTNILVGSKDLRYGSKPSPESLVAVRKVILKAVDMQLPIPVLVPWGGRKMDKSLKLDVAEVSGIRQLLMVDDCIRRIYDPGLQIRVRIEDINAEWLYRHEYPSTFNVSGSQIFDIDEYSSSMQRLIAMLRGDTKIIGVRESDMMSKEEYFRLAAEYSNILNDVITYQMRYPKDDITAHPAYQKLASKGWKGVIPKEQRDYYIERYQKMEPGIEVTDAIAKLSDYFAGSKVRYDLNGRGEPRTDVGSFMQINFAHPVPGAPEGIFNNTLYYRTIPGNMARTHIAPWRAKGYLQMIEEQVTPKLVHPGVKIEDLTRSFVTLVNDNEEDDELIVSADYTYSEDVLKYVPMIPPIM